MSFLIPVSGQLSVSDSGLTSIRARPFLLSAREICPPSIFEKGDWWIKRQNQRRNCFIGDHYCWRSGTAKDAVKASVNVSVHNHVNTTSQAVTDIIGPNYVYLLFCVQKYMSYLLCASIYEIRDYQFIIMTDKHSEAHITATVFCSHLKFNTNLYRCIVLKKIWWLH